MLLPDNVHPNMSIYYNGMIVLKELKKSSEQNLLTLYEGIKKENGMSFSVFLLSLDWLYLIKAVEVDEQGVVRKCL